MDGVMDYMTDLNVFYLKRMLRNLKYLFPQSLEEVDPYDIKVGLTTSKTKAKTNNVALDSKMSTMRIDDINEKIADIRENHAQQTIVGSEGETIVENVNEEEIEEEAIKVEE